MAVATLLGPLIGLGCLLHTGFSHKHHHRAHHDASHKHHAATMDPAGAESTDSLEATAVLMSLMRDMKAQDEVDKRLSNEMTQWCQAVHHQQVSMVQTVKRQLDESGIALRQLEADEQRIKSEISLAESTQKQKEQHLQDSIDTADLALEEFRSEQDQVTKAAGASQELLQLMENAQVQGGSKESLVASLSTMRTELTQEQNASMREHQDISQKLWAFSDRLNSSIMETKSQSAAIKMELSHRKREYALVEEKTSELSGLYKAMKVSLAETKKACVSSDERATDLSKQAALEVSGMQRLWQSLAPEEEKRSTPMSFLQARQQSQGPSKTQNLGAAIATADKDEDSDSDPLASIKNFVETASTEQTKTSVAVASAAGAVQSGSDKLDATTGKSKTEMQKYCEAVTRDAAIDHEAVSRSLKRLDAKLKLVQASETEHEQNAAYFKKQSEAVGKQIKHLNEIKEAENERHSDALNALRRTSDKLGSLIDSMGSDNADDEASQAESEGTTLLEDVKKHQGLLEEGHRSFLQQHQAVASAIVVVQQVLDKDSSSTQRRLLQFKAEAQLLTSLVESKKQDEVKALRFHENSKKLCEGI